MEILCRSFAWQLCECFARSMSTPMMSDLAATKNLLYRTGNNVPKLRVDLI